MSKTRMMQIGTTILIMLMIISGIIFKKIGVMDYLK